MGDRADRLNRRRQDSATEKSDDQSPEPETEPEPEPEEPESATEPQSETASEPEPETEPEQNPDPAGSIKDQYDGIYMFLPDDLLNEFNIVAGEVDSARRRHSGKQVEKIRHFEPLVVALGLEAIENMDDGELEKRLAEFDP